MSYIILNWMDGGTQEFDDEKKAVDHFNKEKKEAIKNNEEFDKSCYKVLCEFNNID